MIKTDRLRRKLDKYKAGTMKPLRIGFVLFEHKPPAGAVAVALTKGCTAWIDEQDWPLVSQYRWFATTDARRGTCCASSASPGYRPGESRITRMHNGILGATGIDHIEHRGAFISDNRRSNLRAATGNQNMHNVRKTNNEKTSMFKGVHFEQWTQRWRSHVEHAGRSIRLGRFDRELDAAFAYDAVAVKEFGEFACTNFKTPGAGNWLYEFMPFGIVRRGAEVNHG